MLLDCSVPGFLLLFLLSSLQALPQLCDWGRWLQPNHNGVLFLHNQWLFVPLHWKHAASSGYFYRLLSYLHIVLISSHHFSPLPQPQLCILLLYEYWHEPGVSQDSPPLTPVFRHFPQLLPCSVSLRPHALESRPVAILHLHPSPVDLASLSTYLPSSHTSLSSFDESIYKLLLTVIIPRAKYFHHPWALREKKSPAWFNMASDD